MACEHDGGVLNRFQLCAGDVFPQCHFVQECGVELCSEIYHAIEGMR